jgi:hypothetical protein
VRQKSRTKTKGQKHSERLENTTDVTCVLSPVVHTSNTSEGSDGQPETHAQNERKAEKTAQTQTPRQTHTQNAPRTQIRLPVDRDTCTVQECTSECGVASVKHTQDTIIESEYDNASHAQFSSTFKPARQAIFERNSGTITHGVTAVQHTQQHGQPSPHYSAKQE